MIRLKNKKTGMYFVSYIKNKPCWATHVANAKEYFEQDVAVPKLIRRLACQSQQVEAVGRKNDKSG